MPRTTQRPPVNERCFTSEAVEQTIASVKQQIADPELAWLFENCFPSTLDTTIRHTCSGDRPDTFVITGDINAMWLRDSTAQVWPYIRLVNQDDALRRLVLGLINRQAACVRIDPYANAFNPNPGESPWSHDKTEMKPELHERKWEIDSLCYVIRLAHGYWQASDDLSFVDPDWVETAQAIVRTFKEQQRFDGPGPYRFQRRTTQATDTLALSGLGYPVKPCGLIASAFRPSDDACVFHFLVPSNWFAVVSLRQFSQVLQAANAAPAVAADADAMADQIETALENAVVMHPVHDTIHAYEVDGYGSRLLMDDANIPSLLALPYLGCCAPDDALYQRTRGFVFSKDNPFFYRGTHGEGIGGPHVGPDMAWPMSIIMRALTSTDDSEIAACLATLKTTHADTGFMHESFNVNDPTHFTRRWFAWVNTLFGELILTLADTKPDLLRG